LPIQNYVTLEGLFLAEDEIWPDGRLRQQLRTIPPIPLLSLLNVKYVLTDKTQDVWIDNVFYDLEHTVPLGEVQLDDLPDFEATDLGVVSYLTGTASLENGTPVAELTLSGVGVEGRAVTQHVTLLAGEHTSEGLYLEGQIAHGQARVGHQWRDDERGNDYLALLSLGEPLRLETIAVRSLLPGEQFHLRGMSLVDQGSGTSRILSINPALPLVHSGDVKIYQTLEALPRAFVAHEAHLVADDAAALALMRDPAFDPGQTVVLAMEAGSPADESLRANGSSGGREGTRVKILSYEPERVRLRADLETTGYLVLTDTYYPGWQVTVDGRPATIQRADVAFRAVELTAGEHLVEFQYRPENVLLGLGLSVAGWLLWSLAFIVLLLRTGRKATSSV